MRVAKVWMTAVLAASGMIAPLVSPLGAQDAAQAPRSSGTVTATSATGLTLKTAAGDVTVAVPAAAKVLVVPPGSKDLKAATAGSLSDVASGDKAIVTGTAGDTPSSLNAVRVILMKADAIAQTHAAEDAAWAKGGGGLVKSVDAADGKIVISSGMKMTTVLVTPTTIVRRYSGDSVRFADAKVSTLAMVRPGDQLRVRGAKAADGTITADELVAGTFRNYSGLIASIDTTAGTITLKDLTTKKTVTVAVTSSSDVHRLPPMLAARVAAQMKGGAAGAPAGGPPAGGPPAGGGGYGGPGAGGPPSDAARAGRAGMDLSAMLSRLPAETLSGLKVGEAVMIVATAPSADAEKSTAVTLLTGVDAVLAASPSGQTTTLTPWSIGGGGEMGGEGGGMGPK